MASTNLRTIWITLRAANYTTNVFTNVIQNCSSLEASEKKLINASLNLGKASMSAGILFGVLGSQIGGTSGQILSYVSYMMYAVSAFSYLKAGILLLNSFLGQHAAIVNFLSSAYFRLAFATAAGFAIFFLLKDWLGPIPALLLAIGAAAAIMLIPLLLAAGAMSTLTWGGASMAGAAGISALGSATSGIMGMVTGFQTGTRMVGKTGPALLHHGEVIYNPSTGRPTQVGNDLAGGIGGTTMIDASMHVDTLNTKASEEQLNELLRKQGRKIANDRR